MMIPLSNIDEVLRAIIYKMPFLSRNENSKWYIEH